ncbi:hypothetical protein BDP27DRAFT_1316609 [Rhodocollybia butyracea]|uniref:Uncharacterized protein n=1 Tax=Rhodocollybia butyracea TaxID=206335 RepID=A0A9P5UCZ8_9AGAR|nr:hypothetical protein BDP27DRAFT_1316609 [Rhodocollybia butyracea]
MIFEALSKEFGLSVGEVSGVYKELGDLEKTKRVLAKILRPSDISLGAPRASSKLSIQKAPWSSPSSKKFVRSQSVAPSSSVSNFPPTPTRLFLSASKSSKRKVASSPSRPCEPFDDDNDADESDELLEVTRSKKRAKPTGLAAKPDFKKAKIAAEEQWTPESRLDSLTRSIELILRSGGLG